MFSSFCYVCCWFCLSTYSQQFSWAISSYALWTIGLLHVHFRFSRSLGVYIFFIFQLSFIKSFGLSLCCSEFFLFLFRFTLNDTDLSLACLSLFCWSFASPKSRYRPVSIFSLIDLRLKLVCGLERCLIKAFYLDDSFTLFILCCRNITALIS